MWIYYTVLDNNVELLLLRQCCHKMGLLWQFSLLTWCLWTIWLKVTFSEVQNLWSWFLFLFFLLLFPGCYGNVIKTGRSRQAQLLRNRTAQRMMERLRLEWTSRDHRIQLSYSEQITQDFCIACLFFKRTAVRLEILFSLKWAGPLPLGIVNLISKDWSRLWGKIANEDKLAMWLVWPAWGPLRAT